jgi:hypothetical protein
VHLRQLAKKKYARREDPGVSRQGEFENTGTKTGYVSKEITGVIFVRGDFFSGRILSFLIFRFFLLRWLSASKGNSKTRLQFSRGGASKFFPLGDFVLFGFGAFLDKGNSNTR